MAWSHAFHPLALACLSITITLHPLTRTPLISHIYTHTYTSFPSSNSYIPLVLGFVLSSFDRCCCMYVVCTFCPPLLFAIFLFLSAPSICRCVRTYLYTGLLVIGLKLSLSLLFLLLFLSTHLVLPLHLLSHTSVSLTLSCSALPLKSLSLIPVSPSVLTPSLLSSDCTIYQYIPLNKNIR
ncbi:hypothetical protein C8Q70DRAFT_357458 [Cubamyces menziesii]|nr:hypothetical protein C8Q70DRAFT_357458 [Cubamyces menziesii]